MELGVEPVEHDGPAVALVQVACRCDDPAAARRGARTPSSCPAPARAPRRPRAGATTIVPPSKRAVACEPIPARSSSSSGSRSQPPRPTTIASLSPSSRDHSSETRPSRMRTIRSAMRADSGSWLTITVVQRCSRTSSASTSYTWSAVAASSSPVGSSARKTFGRCASAAQSATRCCSPPESSAGRRSRVRREADPVEQLVGAPATFGTRQSAQPELDRDELPRGQLRRERAAVVLVGVAEQRRAVLREAARRQLRQVVAVARARDPPTAGRGRRAAAAASTCRSRSGRARSRPRRPRLAARGPAAPRRPLPASNGRGRRPSARSRSRRHLGGPRRRAPAQERQRADEQRRDERRTQRPRAGGAASRATSRSGGSGCAALAVTETSAITSDVRIAPRAIPPSTPNEATSSARSRRCARIVAGDAPCASRSNSSPRSSRTSPTTASSRPTSASSSATAAVPASVSSDPRASGSAWRLGERRRARLHRELGERWAAERRRRGRLAGGRHVDPQLVGRAESRRARVEERARVLPVGDDGVAVDRREPAENADDARRDLLALDLERNDPVRARLGRDARRREHGQRHAVGRLARPEVPFTVGREHVAETGRAAGHAARAEPIGKRRAHALPVDARGPERQHALRARLQADARRSPRQCESAGSGCRAGAGRALR